MSLAGVKKFSSKLVNFFDGRHSAWQMRRVVVTKDVIAFARENEEIMVDQVGN